MKAKKSPLDIYVDAIHCGKFTAESDTARWKLEAAQDMREACQIALDLIKATWIKEHGNPSVGKAWGALERAIAKADGNPITKNQT